MASTNWDSDQKRHRPPAWDPHKLLLVVVSGLHVVVDTSSVVGVVVDCGVWLLGTSIWLRQPGRRERGKEGEKQLRVLIQSTRKQGFTLHMHGYMYKEAISVDWTAECQNKRGIAN